MSSRGTHVFDSAVQSANAWFGGVSDELGTHDQRFVYRVLRVWLHELRDRLDVNDAVAFGAQLPELIRGIYYDGWTPSKVPIKVDLSEYVRSFAVHARVGSADVPELVGGISAAFAKRISPDFLNEITESLPHSLRQLFRSKPVESGVFH